MFCPYCGKQISDGVSSCTFCHKEINTEFSTFFQSSAVSPPPKPVQTQPKPTPIAQTQTSINTVKPMTARGLSMLMLLVSVGVGLYLTLSTVKKQSSSSQSRVNNVAISLTDGRVANCQLIVNWGEREYEGRAPSNYSIRRQLASYFARNRVDVSAGSSIKGVLKQKVTAAFGRLYRNYPVNSIRISRMRLMRSRRNNRDSDSDRENSSDSDRETEDI